MDFQLIAFYLFAAIATLSALAVISVRNPVHAALFLVLTFFTSAAIWLLAEAEFLAIVLVLVYVGAVMVLFLFVVMMLDINTVAMREGFTRYLPVGVLVAVVMAVEMLVLIGVQRLQSAIPAANPALEQSTSNIKWLGTALFTHYLYPFEVAAVILTVAIIAAIVITLRRRPGTKHQDPARQVAVRKEDRVRIIKMAAEGKEAGK
jgi:NADH-quinone oxidoreductase subunit J